MFGIGIPELMLILIIALVVLGPERMPRVARDLGKVLGDLRRTSDELREEFLNADKLLDRAANATATRPAPPAPALPASAQPAQPSVPADPNETLFDREMREARERLRAQRQS
jgi:sec-independent protein translocase protein TatA